jgi:hypothetical protein
MGVAPKRCKGVSPLFPFSFTLVPLSSRVRTSSLSPFLAASIKVVVAHPVNNGRRARIRVKMRIGNTAFIEKRCPLLSIAVTPCSVLGLMRQDEIM